MKLSNLTLAFLALCTSCATSNTQLGGKAQSEHDLIPLVGTQKVHRYTLENGLKLLILEDHSSTTFAIQTWFNVGSRNEVPQYTGLAHLFEHMMFKETKNHPEGEFDQILEAAGAEGENAFTSRDHTAYVQELPKSNLELILNLESDRMVNLVVNEKAFTTEREVVQNERRFRNENSPDGTMYQEIFGLAFTQHSYRWPVIGYEEDLTRMKASDAEDFYKKHYSPNHATLVIVGDVNPEETYSLVKKYYGALKPTEIPPAQPPQEPAQTKPRRKTIKLNTAIEKLMIAYHIPEAENHDYPSIAVLRAVLSGGKSSRLNRALVETGVCSSIEAYDLEDRDPSILIVAANLQKKKKATQAETIILREIKNLIQTKIGKEELERAKNQLSFAFFEGLSGNSERANFLGQYETLLGDFRKAMTGYDAILKVTPEDVQAMAKKYLDPMNRSVLIGVAK